MKIVALDLDDTLYKEEDYVKSAYRAIAEDLGDDMAYEILISAWNNGTDNPFDVLMSYRADVQLSRLLQIYRYHYPTISLADDVTQFLNRISRISNLAIITDGRSISQRNKIKSLGVGEYVDNPDNIIISEETGMDKTSANNFRILQYRNPLTDRFYYIGDNSAKDFYWPNRLGYVTICVKDDGRNIHSQDIEVPEEYAAQYVVERLADAENIIGKVGRNI